MALFSSVIGFLFSVIAGIFVARRLSVPSRTYVWLLLLFLFVIVGKVGINTKIISINEFSIFLNYTLQGILFGVIVGFLFRKKDAFINQSE